MNANDMYTYDGNSNETYYLFKQGRVIAELFMGEDDAAAVNQMFNDLKVELDVRGCDLSEMERSLNRELYETLERWVEYFKGDDDMPNGLQELFQDTQAVLSNTKKQMS